MKKLLNRARRVLFLKAYSIELISNNINVDFYSIQSGVNSKDPVLLAEHYVDQGTQDNLDPTLYFSTQKYIEDNPDVKLSKLNPFAHYLLHGKNENRVVKSARNGLPPLKKGAFGIESLDIVEQVKIIKPHFDYPYYQTNFVKKFKSPEAAILHYIDMERTSKHAPTPHFSPQFYLKDNPDLVHAEFCLFLHYIQHGQHEGRQPNERNNTNHKKNASYIRNEFDVDYYNSQQPNYVQFSGDPVINFLENGYDNGLNPNKAFNSVFYKLTNPDLATVGMNGFVHYILHGKKELRAPKPYYLDTDSFKPLISVIVPNYNHARFLEERIESIIKQTYDNLEIVILDDCSKDNSRDVINSLIQKHSDKNIRKIFNRKNSGNVFKQWKKGIENASGDYVWICESDDFCEINFLEKLIPHFADRSVNIAFGKIQFSDKDGNYMEGMDNFREQAEAGIWRDSIKRPARKWFNNGLGVNNVIANVGGCVFKKPHLSTKIWNQAKSFKIAGDWFLYLHIAGGGQIVYEPRSVAYFRQHDKNTSATNFNKLYYYEELNQIFTEIESHWATPQDTKDRFIRNVSYSFQHWKMKEQGCVFDEIFNQKKIHNTRKPHVLIGFLGFISGGAEVFAINLANALHKKGYMVSMLAVSMKERNEDMLKKLRSGIPVYSSSNLAYMSRNEFFESTGVELVHSNVLGIENLLFPMVQKPSFEVPYVVSLHGSYDGLSIDRPEVQKLLKLCQNNVSYWVNTAEKNIKILKDSNFDLENKNTMINNGMPVDKRPFSSTRADLNIPKDAFIFTFVARGVKGKGWAIAVKAFQKLQKKIGKGKAHLIMVGDGDVAEAAVRKIKASDDITYLGYQSEINGIYRLSDCALVPTRFIGESYPLCVIQALQEHLPVIATDHGEIKNMLTNKGKVAGHILEFENNDKLFTESVADAMMKLYSDTRYRNKLIKIIPTVSEKFKIEKMIAKYERIYGLAKTQHIKQKKARG